MKIAAAQSRPMAGHVEGNLKAHLELVRLAAQQGARLIVFPELSLTGYEPHLARQLAILPDDSRLECLQSAAERWEVSIAVGAPTRGEQRPRISTLLFRPGARAWIYSKQHLHADELPYFEPGPAADGLMHDEPKIALAICYELSIAEHAEKACGSGATVYVASVAKTMRGVEDARRRLAEIARENSLMPVLSNSLGMQGGEDCVGRSAAWDRDGVLLAELDAHREGVIVVDSETNAVAVAMLGERA